MRKKRNGKKLRSALAILLAGSMMLGMVPGGMGQVYAADAETAVKEEQTGLLGKAKDFLSDMGERIADSFTGESAEVEPAAAYDENVVADPSTVDTWEEIVKNTTENIGRIWTDKTVLTGDIKLKGGKEPSVKKGDSDFLVGLSALSSTSNTVETVSRPLDIVLVVDTSGSMDDSPHMGTRPDSERYQYEEIYAGNLRETKGQEYYTKDGDTITSAGQSGLFWWEWEFTHWELKGQTVEPKTSAEDPDPKHIQFYERRDLGENITKLEALQDAVNNFVEQTARMNDSIQDVNLQHRVSLVKFASDEINSIGNSFTSAGYNRSQIVTELQSYTTENVSNLTSTVDDLTASGATRADYGLNQAQRAFQLGGTRVDAQKVVVFFTDGQPTSGSEWSNRVAADAITNAKALKDANTLIYSIGVFQDANPNDTDTDAGNFNGYMHAVSSNYPYATATDGDWGYSCTLGKRADNSDYYKAAKDATELNKIFDEISDDLETGLGFPTQTPTQDYDPGKVGYITFTDQLGEYMQVDEFKSLVFADQIFNPVSKLVTEGDVTTYKYEGSATGDSELYPNGNVRDIIVQVRKGENLKTGDTVTVKIPAGLIPLRHFTVDTDNDGNKTMKIDEAYPLRIFYGVSIKPEVQERIADGLNPDDADDEALQKYMNDHNEAGAAQFYSNYYNGQYTDPNGKKLGNTIASFQPSKKNTFYYFTEDTPIYTDEKCTIPVTGEPSANTTYYYKRPYVELTGDGVVDVPANVEVAGANFQYASENFDINSNGECYIKSGSARLTRVDALVGDKEENTTNTAEVVIDPIWDNVNNPDYLKVYLGNNGRLDLELPGTLAISKDARVAANKNLDADEILKDKKFKFQISIPSMKEKTVKAEVRNEQNEIQGTAFDLTFNREGIAEHQIKNDETLYIHGLDKDAAYTVTEKSLPDGFELTAVDKNTDAKQATGTIVSGQSASHLFENTYDVQETTLTDADFAKYEKQFSRWDIANIFQIELIATTDGAPLPGGAVEGRKSVDVTEQNSTGNFGAITYSHPGVYEYVVQEKQPASTIPGVVYSLASYTYRVTVTDNGDGTLSAAAVMEKTVNDDGTSVGDTPTPVENKTAVFVNDFQAESATTSILARKAYTDNSGAKPLLDRMFEFKLKATGDNADQAPMPTGEKDSEGYVHAFNDGTGIAFGNMVFTEDHVGTPTPWTYEIKEVIPAGAVANQDGTYTLNGMTYDGQTYTVSITATAQGSGDDARIVIEKKYSNEDGAVDEDQVVFNNSYAATGELDGNTKLEVTKNLQGRDWLDSDSFSFKLEATGKTAQAVEDQIVTLPDNASELVITGTDEDHKASFGNIKFTKPGTYTFQVTEAVPEGAENNVLNGITYYSSVKKITVNVTDNNAGKLIAVVADESDNLTFRNVYKASSIGLGEDKQFKVTKNLVGREWTDGDGFKFTLTAKDGAPMPAEDGNVVIARKAEKTQKFGEITYDAAGTYEYQITETVPKNPEEGMTYDRHTATVTVKVTEDYATGTLSIKSVTYSDGADATEAQFTNVVGNNTKDVQNTEGGSLDNGMVGVGDELTYVINWVNDGVDETGAPAAATVKVTDIIPTGTEYVEGSAEGAEYDVDARNLTWTIEAEAAQTGSVSFKVVVTDKAGGTEIENEGNIKVGENDSKVTNIVKTTVPGKKETTNPDKIEDGTILTYEIKFRNTDGENATATVVDKMTTGLEYQVGTATVNDQVSDPNVAGDSATGQTLTWNLERLAENAEVTIRFNVKVTRDALDSVDNSATVNGHKSNVVTTPYPSDDKKTVEDKDGNDQNNGMVGVGDELTYVIDWAADEAGKVTITDIVPTGTEFVSAKNGGVHENGTVTWVIKDAKKGQKGSVSFTVKVTGEAGGKDVRNKANVKVGDNKPKVTNEVKTFIPGKDSALAEGDTELQVGDVLTYTISYKNPEDTAATVTITDKLPEGLTFVEASNDGGYANGTLTWTLTNVPAGRGGTVTFKASVNENAKKEIENTATIQVGENSPKYSTDTDGKTLVEDGNLAISKTIAMTEGQGTKIDKEKEFTFTVTLKDTAGKDLIKQYAYTIKNGDKEVSTGNVKNNGTLKLKHGETATITGLPSGAQYTVTETPEAGYTSDQENNTVTGTIPTKETATADFMNTYSVTGSLTGSDALTVTKKLVGREWLDTDSFAYTLTPADDATTEAVNGGFITLPVNEGKLEITKESAEHQEAFGDIQFTIAGTFKFNVTEQPSGIDGITDDLEAERTVVVKVTDKKDGTLDIAIVKDESENLTFTNTYGAGTGEEDIAAQIPATKKLTGRDMNAKEFQFEVVTRKADEAAEGFKEEVVAVGTNEAGADGEAEQFTFAGSDANGDIPLNYTTESLNEAVKAGYATKEGNVWTVNYTAREKKDSLPKGVTPVEGKTEFNFTIVVTDNTDGTLTAEVQTPEGGIAFENTYATGGTDVNTDPTEATAYFNKKLTGRDWKENDSFTFTITPKDGAPAPEGAAGDGTKTVTVTSDSAKADALVPFGFGTIRFTDAHMEGATPNDDGTVSKTFTYDVTEVIPEDGAKIPGITYDGHTATLAITVTDNLQGELSATAALTAANGTFTNTYRSKLVYNAVGGLQISKVLNGRDMQKDQFTFTLTPKATEGSTTAEEAAQKLGFAEVKAYEFKNEAAAMGEATYMNVLSGKEVVFTQADAGKTYTYEIVEVKGQNEAYTYDEAVNIVTITVVDNNNGTLTVTTTVTKNREVVDTKVVSTGDAKAAPATAPFVNVYNDVPESLGGEGSVAINATKSLTNRPMADEEFTFHVTDKNGAQVATGNNDASGKITFTPIEYTTDKLNEDAEKGTATKRYDVEKDAYTYTYQYKVEEDLNNVDEGVTGIVTAFSIQVVVTDDGNGNLTIAVVYPDGKDSLPFENAYGTSAEAAIHVNGQKVLNVESGNNAPDITGKYTFTLSGSDGAPMPEKATANNDAAGNVDFGKITYTMQNVFGDTGVTAEAEGTEEALTEVMPVSDTRTKTFTYTVTESGTVEGVTNDAESVKTFNVTVTDNGDGTIKVDKDYTGFEFGFTNTYHVEPVDFDINDAEAGITVKKELAGRAMNAGEFVFELISDKDKSVREAVNDTDGNVKFETMNFTAPGEYIYTLRERNTKLGGVDYDTTEYQVVVTVTDNGDGTMSAEAKLADEGKDVVFKNQYEAAPTSVMFGASKIYKGADLKDGQFTFVVKDADGNVVSEAKNNKDGMVTFDTIEFNEEGTYTFTISEKNDKQKNVTYDKAVYEVTVTVTDNGEGSLIAEVAYADGKAPVFTNKYTKPAEPSKPEEPKKPGAVQTGDSTPIVGLVVAMVVALAAIVAVAVIFFRRRRR